MPVGLKIESQVCRAFQPPLQSSIGLSVGFGPKATGTPIRTTQIEATALA